jgi:hypothetical protein
VALIFGSFPEAGVGEGLAGVAAAEDVDGFDGGPVDGGDVAEVGDLRPVVGEDLVGAGVDVGDPCGGAAEHGLYGGVESAVAGADGADPQAGHRCCPPVLRSRMFWVLSMRWAVAAAVMVAPAQIARISAVQISGA